jgi:ribosomal protein L12E/L44/L45/RPP1/RPP2
MPRIGCGLDNLEWDRVSSMLKKTFEGTNMKITVYSLDDKKKATAPPSPAKSPKESPKKSSKDEEEGSSEEEEEESKSFVDDGPKSPAKGK